MRPLLRRSVLRWRVGRSSTRHSNALPHGLPRLPGRGGLRFTNYVRFHDERSPLNE